MIQKGSDPNCTILLDLLYLYTMIKELTSLRFILILVIFFHHALPSYPGGGDMGVACFFVLSGFCYALGYGSKVKAADFNYRGFIKSRLAKFYPLHWITLLIAIPISLHVGLGWKNGVILGINGLLLQSWIPLSSVYYSFNGVSWFLSDMVFLVAVFPFLSRLLDSGSRRWLFIIPAVAVYCILCIWTPADLRNAILYVNPVVRLCDFAVGILSGMWYLRLKDNVSVTEFVQRHKVFLRIVSAASLLVLLFMSVFIPEQYTLMAFMFWPAAVLMLICISLNPGGLLSTPLLQRLGQISFPFYMIHQLVIRYLDILSDIVVIDLNRVALVLIALFVSIVFSFLLNKYVIHLRK